MYQNIFYLFALFILGVLLRKRFEKNIDALIDFIIYISLPSLIISHIYRLNLDISFIKYTIFGWGIILFSILLSFFIGKILRLEKKSLISFIIISSFGNTAFLGYPYIETFLGKKALGYAIIFDNFASFLPVVTVGVILISLGGKKARIDFKKIFTFPPFLTLLVALFLRKFQIDKNYLEIFEKIGLTVTPLAIFAVGVKIEFLKLENRKLLLFLSLFIKMVFIPIVSFLLLKLFFGLDIKSKAILFEIAMPPMVLASIMIMKAKLDSYLAALAVGVGALLSFFTIPAIYLLIG